MGKYAQIMGKSWELRKLWENHWEKYANIMRKTWEHPL
jgi:hypothetical protein